MQYFSNYINAMKYIFVEMNPGKILLSFFFLKKIRN